MSSPWAAFLRKGKVHVLSTIRLSTRPSYSSPEKQYQLDDEGQPTGIVLDGRRESIQVVPVPAGERKVKQGELQLDDGATTVKQNQWSTKSANGSPCGGPGVASTTPEQLRKWRHLTWSRKDRSRKLFFCQIEAVETLIYLTEVDPSASEAKFRRPTTKPIRVWSRLASKMATGSGKTTVMAMIVAWHSVNKARQPNSKKFTDAFLVICPGITIRDRLRVLHSCSVSADLPSPARREGGEQTDFAQIVYENLKAAGVQEFQEGGSNQV